MSRSRTMMPPPARLARRRERRLILVLVLVEVARLRLLARSAGITDVVTAGTRIRFAPVHLPESRTLRLSRLYPGSLYKAASGTVLIQVPKGPGLGAKPLADHDLLQWVRSVIESVVVV